LAVLELPLTRFLTSKKVDLIQVQQSRRFDNLDETTQQIVTGLTDIRRTVAGDLNSQIQALTQILDRGEVVITPDAKTKQRKVFGIKQADEHASSFKDKELCTSVRNTELMMRRDVAKDVLKNLYYPTIKERFEEVAEAHQKTFNWVFQGPKANTTYSQWSNFAEWLQNDHGLYWISGKAGSGKSTLMKYIYSDTRMRSIATSWAAASTLCIAGFFFWSSGTKEQRSQSGLLRSLLYDTLSQFPSLIPIVLPSQWASCYSAKCSLTELPQVC
jgi:chromosomal replication initiation ATPase DnaA